MIYKYALDRISKQEAQELFKNYTIFEKKFGDRRGIEDIIVSKRRFQYEEEVKVSVTGRHRRACQPGLSPPCVCSKPEVTPRGGKRDRWERQADSTWTCSATRVLEVTVLAANWTQRT